MRKLFTFATVAVAAMTFAACQKSEINAPETLGPVTITVTANADGFANETKTYLGEYEGVANTVLWGEDEQMTIAFIGESLITKNSTKTSDFNGKNQATFDFSLTPTGDAPYTYAGVYPTSAVVTNSNTNAQKYKVTLSDTQNATADSYDPSTYIMVAKPEQFNEVKASWMASYRRATALNVFTLKGLTENIEKVEITAPEGQYLAGRRYFDLTTGESGEVYYDKTETITVKFTSPLTGGADMNVWFTSWGQTIQSGSTLTIKAYSDKNSYTRTITARSSGIILAEGALNKLTINMAASDVVVESLEQIINTSTAENPYTAAEAIELASKLEDKTLENVYVRGIVSKIDNIDVTSYYNATYYISDDGSTTNQFEIYRGKYIDGADFESEDQLELGDEVVVCGTLVYYNQKTPEFNEGSKIISIIKAASYSINLAAAENGTITASASKATAGTVITLSATPNDGYLFDEFTVVDESGNPVSVSNNKFKMPASSVTVTAIFKEKPAGTVYVLEPTSGSNNAYANNCDITIDGITWNLTGNSQINPWRIGGKSLTNIDRELYSKTKLEYNINKIEIKHGAASGITVNSMTLIVSTDEDFSSVVSTLSPTFAASETVTIERPDGKDWSNCYYKIVYNVTVAGTSNKFLEFVGADFYGTAANN